MDVSVIVPVKDDPQGLAACLAALEAQTLAGRAEVIVVDNGSAPGRRATLGDGPSRLAARRLLQEPRPGSYHARNTALAAARGRVIAFTDADCRPAPDWLARGVQAVADPRVGLVAGRIAVTTRAPGVRTGAELYDLRHAFPQALYVRTTGFGATANVITRRDVVDAVGPFDAGLQSGGDREWGTRVGRAGYLVRYAEDVVVQHPARRTLTEIRSKIARTHTGDLELLRRQGRGVPAGRVARRLLPPVRAVARGLTDPELDLASERVRYTAAFLAVRYSYVAQDLISLLRPARG